MTLVMFSGGMDSFLAAALKAEAGETVTLVFCNNGCVLAEQNILHGVARLQNRFTENRVLYAGALATAGSMHRLKQHWMYAPMNLQPNVSNCQLQCLICQTAMWVHSIAYAYAHGIKKMCCGYKSTDTFCTGNVAWINEIKKLASRYDIEVELPMWDKTDNDRYMMMLHLCFEPQVLEPKCMIGCPPRAHIEGEQEALVDYYRYALVPLIPECIESMVRHYKVARLSSTSYTVFKYDPPKGGGIY